MKTKHLLIAIVSLLFFQISNLSAQSFRVKNFKMNVLGSSTMHDWESQVEKLECKGSYKIEGNVLADIKEAVVKIPVKSIKSPKGYVRQFLLISCHHHLYDRGGCVYHGRMPT